ncbi:MAG: AMP-binding protein, partial [Pseudomonadota bacterium]
MSVTRPATFHGLTVASGIHSCGRSRGQKTALRVGERSLTYAELSQRVRRICGAGLVSAGGERGRRAALLAPNCIEYPEIVCGLAEAGMITATINPRRSH